WSLQGVKDTLLHGDGIPQVPISGIRARRSLADEQVGPDDRLGRELPHGNPERATIAYGPLYVLRRHGPRAEPERWLGRNAARRSATRLHKLRGTFEQHQLECRMASDRPQDRAQPGRGVGRRLLLHVGVD